MNWLNIPGRLRQEEGELLRELAAGQIVLEIGSLFGRSTICMAQVAEHVHAIDPHRPGNCDWCDEFRGRSTLSELRQNLRTAKLTDRVSLHLCTVAELWPPAEPIFGLAFIDGNHSRGSALLDLAFAWQTVRPGGMIALHDHGPGCPGVLEAVAEFGRPVVRQVKTTAVIEVTHG